MDMQYQSHLLENAVDEFAKLPGIGRKTALRLVLHLLRQEPDRAVRLGESMIKLRQDVKYCKSCFNICDTEVCSICSDERRDPSIICVVENIKEVMIVERTRQFHGLYHVLGGLISPMEGIGPQQLQIESLIERVKKGDTKEVILALSTTMEGDTTDFYIFRKLSQFPDVKVTTLARGVSVGDEIEYADEITLGKSISNRVLFSDNFGKNV
ncbi:MAG: recombination protein RecR [Bacteroidales bacterium]|nr:recombination protein RecR [Bacteroidales bacterium]